MSKSTVVVIGVSAIVLTAIGMHSISLNTEIDALKTQIGKQTAALDRLSTSLKRFETCAHMVNGSVGGKRLRKKSPTEVQPPRGPMPTSILAETERRPNDPLPGTDITSDLTQRRPKGQPCFKPCDALRACSMKGGCSGLDTRKEDTVTDLCFDACRVNRSLRDTLKNQTDCVEFLSIARRRIAGFTEICPDTSQ